MLVGALEDEQMHRRAAAVRELYRQTTFAVVPTPSTSSDTRAGALPRTCQWNKLEVGGLVSLAKVGLSRYNRDTVCTSRPRHQYHIDNSDRSRCGRIRIRRRTNGSFGMTDTWTRN